MMFKHINMYLNRLSSWGWQYALIFLIYSPKITCNARCCYKLASLANWLLARNSYTYTLHHYTDDERAKNVLVCCTFFFKSNYPLKYMEWQLLPWKNTIKLLSHYFECRTKRVFCGPISTCTLYQEHKFRSYKCHVGTKVSFCP